MSRFASIAAITVLGLMALGAVGPRIAQVIRAAVPLVLVVGVVVAALRIVWAATRNW